MPTKIDLSNFDSNFIGRSSYKTEKYSKVLRTVCLLKRPKKIVEFGILDGYSLDCFIEASPSNCEIHAFDLFEDFPYNSADPNSILYKYSGNKNVKIEKMNVLNALGELEEKGADIIHVDVANDGDIYEFSITNLMDKITESGVLILEGGSEERDNIDWMIKYNKPKIRKVLEKYSEIFDIKVFNEFPSLTIIQRL